MKIKDLITVCDLLEENLTEFDELQADDGKWFDVHEALYEIAEVLKKRQWIPVSERLPKKDTDILVTYVDGEDARIVPVNYGDGTWYDCIFNNTLDSHKVVAWMPLPEPYEEEETED